MALKEISLICEPKIINEEKLPSIDIDGLKNINVFAYNNHLAILEQNELKILSNGRGYVCPLCGFSNSSFSACAQCKYSPFENISEQTPATDGEYIDITCPKCGELLSFLKGETNGLCPECGAEFEI